MTVIELPQGYYRDLTGTRRDVALAQFAKDDASFLATHPQCKPFHRPRCVERDVRDDATAPWGYEWYVADARGVLFMHSAHYDSSD